MRSLWAQRRTVNIRSFKELVSSFEETRLTRVETLNMKRRPCLIKCCKD